ncbi:hypothetical protein BC941DRAFT_460063 [Chlamydoabsidia padenii]|nr:hypothetical protein BC941DRAFT_460063 [Chlamydoabsidia padenii]
MIPQHYPFQANNTQPFYQHEQPDLHLISADEINTQYEELEKTKQMITRRLSELQNQQRRTQGIHQDHQLPTRNPTTYLAGYSDRSIPPRLKPVTPASLMRQHQQKPPRRKPKQPSTSHASPRALKPLLISPGLNPAPPSSDTEHNLMTRSNYQNLMEGKAAVLGFSPTIKSGIEVRRTAHKAAEQKRRDSLKEWFERLRHEVEEGYVKGGSKRQRDDDDDDDDEDDPSKPMSKVLLLRYAYEYIAQLKDSLVERDDLIASLMKK